MSYSKYYLDKKQESYDKGVTWNDVYDEEGALIVRLGELIASGLTSCDDEPKFYYIYCNRGYIGLENSGFDANREDLPIEGDETFKWIIEPIDESWFYIKNSTNNAYISRDVNYGIFRCREDFNDYRMKFCVNLENVLCCVYDDSTIDDRLFSFGVDGGWKVYIGTTWFKADNGSQWNFRKSDFFIPTKTIPTSEIEYGQEYYKPNELWCRYVTFNEGDTITITLDLGECVDRNENIITINHYLSNMREHGIENGFNMYYPYNGDNTQLNMTSARFNHTTSIDPNSTIEIKIVYGGKVLINGEDSGYDSSWITEHTDSNFFFIGSFEGSTRSNARMTVIKTKDTPYTIYYTSTDGNIVNPTSGLTPTSNIYIDGLGIMTFDEYIETITEQAFEGCVNLATIELPNSVTSIGHYAFQNCSSLTSIEIPSNVTSIGSSLFRKCTSLTSVTIPSGVTDIINWTFGYCTSLSSITYNGTIAQWNSISKGSNWKRNVPSTCIVHCTDGDTPI